MPIVVGRANESLPCSRYKFAKKSTDMADTESEPGTSGDGYGASSPTENFLRQFSSKSLYDDSDDDGDEDGIHDFVLGPLIPLKDQLEKDKEDESLRRWKTQLLGSIHMDAIEDGTGIEPQVKLLSLTILSPDRPDITLLFPLATREHLFTLKEGTPYNFKFTFIVRHNIVCGLTFLHAVWKNGLRVDHSRVMLGTFSPQLEPYTQVMEEDITPSGILARGTYTAHTQFIDDDGRSHFELDYSFDIRKDW
eukprot:c19648_g2_i1 orf=1375-2124(+)